MNITNIVLILLVAIYFIVFSAYLIKRSKTNKVLDQLQPKTLKMFFWEKSLLQKVKVEKRYIKPVIYLSRFLIFGGFIAVSFKIGAIAVFFVIAGMALVFANKKTEALIEEAGINSIPELNSFLDSYVPALASGLSNDQAMSKYINGKNDQALFEWWANRENSKYAVDARWKRTIEIYKMIKFNEDRGIEDSLPIIEQMQKDINVKQSYYNEYKAKMGEIQPILFSYYIFVPILLFVSLSQTKDFWFSLWGYVSAIGLIGLFVGSQFMVYKIRQSTIKVMF